MPLEPGSRIGPFEVLSRLGAGGMGEVWRARDTRLQRDVAIKILPEAFAQDPDRLARFTREAHVLASLNHPNIAAIYSFEEIDGMRLLVLELVVGETLKQRIVRAPVPVNEAIRIALQIADALEAAHEKGVLHRDLKPANVAVTPGGKVKLLDFGLAKAFALGAASPDISHSPTLAADPTHQGVVLGTASYMSPEQARSRALDGRSDLWAFGCVLFETLAGRKAFDGETVSDILVAILDREPDWAALPPATPPQLVDLMKRLLRKPPGERPATVGEVKGALEAAAGSRTTAMISASTFQRLAPRSRLRAFVVAAAAVALGAAAFLWFPMRERPGKALPASKLLAILPATDLTGRPDGRQLCDGTSFSLGVKLQSVPGIAVMPPSSPAMLKEGDPAKWARDTGANLLVQPAVRQMGAERELSFSISQAGSPVQIAADSVKGPADDHFRLEDELARKLVAALQIHLATGQAVPTPSPAIPAGAPQTDYVVALGYLERYDDKASVDRAVALLSALPASGESAPVQAMLGRAYLASFRLSKDVAAATRAAEAAERAIALSPDDPNAQITLAEVRTLTGRYADAIGILRRVLERDARNVSALLALVTALQRSGDASGAESAALQLVELRPTSPTVLNRLGTLYFLTSRYDKAVDAYQRAIKLNPEILRAHFNLGAAFLRLGRFEEASAALKESIRLEPNPLGYSNLGVAQYLLGRFDDAAASFRQAAALAPKNYRFQVYLGDALAQVPGREAEARAAYEAALPLVRAELSVNPNDAVSVVRLGRCLARTGEREKGWAEIQRGVSLAPDDENVLEPAAAAAMVLGKKAEALAWLGKAVARGYSLVEIRRDPDFTPLRGEPAFERLESPASKTASPTATGEKR